MRPEDEFQKYVMRHHILPKYPTRAGFKRFCKVKKIAVRTLLSEIDLIVIDPNNQKVIGYEFKFLHDVKTPSNNYKAIYSGFGQALLYFYFGVDQSYLCIGISEKLPKYERIKEKTLQLVSAMDNLGNLMNSKCFGLYLYSERDDFFRFLPATGYFPVHKIKLSQQDKEHILAENISYAKDFLK
jgi:hypothetical protein